jgi:biotin operon repressor
MAWTEAMDAQLIELRRQRLNSVQIAEKMGLSKSQVKNRARRIGLTFNGCGPSLRGDTDGHRAADEKSAQLLREAGVWI